MSTSAEQLKFVPDAPAADPTDFTDRYNTQLSPSEERAYGKWLQSLPEGQRSTYDYDMRGAWKAGAGLAANGHFPDTFKKPNHPTFSTESQYSGKDDYTGGAWAKQPDGSWTFTPTASMLKMHDREDLQKYFADVEKGNKLVLPAEAAAASTAGLRFVPDAPAASAQASEPSTPPRRPSLTDPLGAALYEVTGPLAEGIAGELAGNARGVYDVLTGRGLDQAARDLRETEQEYQERYHPRTAVGEASNKATQWVAGKLGQARDYVGDVLTRGDPQEFAKQQYLKEWRQGKHPEVTPDQLRAAGMLPRGVSFNEVNPEGAAIVRQGAGALTNIAAGEALGATANAVGRIARRTPYTVEAESTAPRGPTTVEGEATPVNRRPGLPNPNPPAGGAGRPLPGGGTPGGGEGAGGGGAESRSLPYHPADPTIIPARLPSAPRRTRGQSASGLRDGRMLDPVLIDGRTGEVIDHPAMEEPKAAPGEPEAAHAAGVASEDSGGAPPPQVPIDSPPIGGGLPSPAHAARAAILRRVLGPGAQVRLSVITGNALDAADDYAVSGVNQPAGQAAKMLIDGEWPSVVRYGHRIIREVGGTSGMERGDLERRGKALVAPVEEGLRPWFKARKKELYDTANERGKTQPPTMLQGVDVLLDDPAFAQGLAMRGQEGFVKSAKAIVAHFRGMPGNEHGFTPDAAEAVSKWFNEHWTPQNAWAIGKVVRAIREDVAKAAGDDQFQAARQTHIEEQNLLGEDTGLSDFFEVNPRNPRLRSIAYEDIPGQMMRLPLEQFRQLVELYENPPKNAPAAVKRQSKAALAELRAQSINELLKVGSPSVDEGSWSTPKVKAFLRDNNARIEILFRNLPEATQMVRDLISTGQMMRINRGYRGAGPQNTNVFQTGLVDRGAAAVAGAAGLGLGHIIDPTGVVGPMVTGAATAKVADLATKGRIRKRQMKAWGERVVNLDDIAPPEPGQAPPAPKKPRGPRKPPGGGAQPAARAAHAAPSGTAPAAGGSAPAASTAAPAAQAPQPAATPTPSASAAPAPSPAATGGTPTPGAFPAQGYTRSGYDRAQLAHEMGADPRAVGDRALMLHNEAQKAEQAGDEPRARLLIAERDSLVDASLAKQGLPPRAPPNTLASTEAPPAPSAPAPVAPTAPAPAAPPGQTLADTDGSSTAARGAPVATGPTLASVSEEAPPATAESEAPSPASSTSTAAAKALTLTVEDVLARKLPAEQMPKFLESMDEPGRAQLRYQLELPPGAPIEEIQAGLKKAQELEELRARQAAKMRAANDAQTAALETPQERALMRVQMHNVDYLADQQATARAQPVKLPPPLDIAAIQAQARAQAGQPNLPPPPPKKTVEWHEATNTRAVGAGRNGMQYALKWPDVKAAIGRIGELAEQHAEQLKNPAMTDKSGMSNSIAENTQKNINELSQWLMKHGVRPSVVEAAARVTPGGAKRAPKKAAPTPLNTSPPPKLPGRDQ